MLIARDFETDISMHAHVTLQRAKGSNARQIVLLDLLIDGKTWTTLPGLQGAKGALFNYVYEDVLSDTFDFELGGPHPIKLDLPFVRGHIYIDFCPREEMLHADEIRLYLGDKTVVCNRGQKGITGALFGHLEEQLLEQFSDDEEIDRIWSANAAAEDAGKRLNKHQLGLAARGFGR